MRYGRGFTSLLALVATIGLGVPQVTQAQSVKVEKNQILVTGVVPDRRVIILGTDLKIDQIFSNTDKNVAPDVVVGGMAGYAVPMTPGLQQQYDEIMGQLKPNHVVTISADGKRLPDIYPNFAAADYGYAYVVKPTVMNDDPAALSYVVTSSTN